MSIPTIPSGDSGGWWRKPENRTSAIFFLLALGAVVWFWGLLVPFLLAAADDTLHLVITGVALFAVYEAFTSKRIRSFARLINRWITGWFVAIDPIGIRKNHIEETERKKKELEDSTAEIRGLRLALRNRLNTNKGAYDNSMRMLQAAQATLASQANDERKRQAQRVMSAESKHSDGLAALITKQGKHMEHYDMVLNVLIRYGEVCDDVILDLKNEVSLQEQDEKESSGFKKGMKAAFGIFKGGTGTDAEMDEMAREEIERRYSQRMGEVENFLDMTKGVIAKADFNDEAALADVQNKLDSWGGKNSQMQIGRNGSTKQEMIAAASIDTPQKAPLAVNPDDYFK